MQENAYIGHLVKIINNGIRQRLTANAEQLGLTAEQGRILHHICRNSEKGVCQRDVEEHFELSHATVAGLVTRLEGKGFVRTLTSEKDKRIKTIFPTEKALERDSEMFAFIKESEDRFTEGFSPEEKEQLKNYLVRILKNMGVELSGEECKK